MNSKVLLTSCCLVFVLVLVAPTECRRNQTNLPTKRRPRTGRNRITGGKPDVGIQHWLGTIWSQPDGVPEPFVDGNFHGLGINIGPRLMMAQNDTVQFFFDRITTKPRPNLKNPQRLIEYKTPNPEKINVKDGAGRGPQNSRYNEVFAGPWRWRFYRRSDRKGVDVPFFNAPWPRYETDKTKFGDGNCVLYGYSQTAKLADRDERWFARANVTLISSNCADHICEMATPENKNTVCYGYHDVGAPIICGPERKLTFITVFVQNPRGGQGCHHKFRAYHVPFLYDSIKDAINSEKAKGKWDKQSDDERFN